MKWRRNKIVVYNKLRRIIQSLFVPLERVVGMFACMHNAWVWREVELHLHAYTIRLCDFVVARCRFCSRLTMKNDNIK